MGVHHTSTKLNHRLINSVPGDSRCTLNTGEVRDCTCTAVRHGESLTTGNADHVQQGACANRKRMPPRRFSLHSSSGGSTFTRRPPDLSHAGCTIEFDGHAPRHHTPFHCWTTSLIRRRRGYQNNKKGVCMALIIETNRTDEQRRATTRDHPDTWKKHEKNSKCPRLVGLPSQQAMYQKYPQGDG